jgi:cell division transport system permease protein
MTVAAVTTIAVALLVVGTAVLLGLNLSHMAATLEAQVEVVAFLHDGLSSAELGRAQQAIEAMPEVASVQFVSRAQALGRLRQRLGEKAAFDDLEAANPLADSLEVRVVDPTRTRVVAAAVAGVPGIDEVTFGARVLDRLLALTSGVRMLAALLTLFLSGVALVVVVNTIRLTVMARQREIEIMRLVGATRWFVQWPLLLEGVLEGAAAAAVAVVVLAALYAIGAAKVAGALPFLPLVPVAAALQAVTIVVAATGTIVGAAGSLIAVRRFVMS